MVERIRLLLEQEPKLWAVEVTATVTPMGTVNVRGTSYSATARGLGAPATVLIRRRRLDISVGNERCCHVREDGTGEVRRLPEQRAEVLSVLHSRRKIATFRRQCLLELGQPAWDLRGPLVHTRPNGQIANQTFTVHAVQHTLQEAT